MKMMIKIIMMMIMYLACEGNAEDDGEAGNSQDVVHASRGNHQARNTLKMETLYISVTSNSAIESGITTNNNYYYYYCC